MFTSEKSETGGYRKILLTLLLVLRLATKSSSSSCQAISMDIPDPLPPLRIIHCFRQVLRATYHIGTELLYVCSSWSSCLGTSMWRGPREYITYELFPTSPTVSHMSGLSNFDSFHDWWLVALKLLLCGGAASRTCSILLTAFLCSCHQATKTDRLI